MELEELIKKGSSAIRNSNELMGFFVKYYEEHFNDKPECYGCSWNKTFNKLAGVAKNSNKDLKINSMKTFIIKKGIQNDIISYKKNKKTHRIYLRDSLDEFIIEYLSNGSAEEIEQRKLIFEKFPDGFETETEKEIEVEVEVNENKDALSNKKAKTKRNKQ